MTPLITTSLDADGVLLATIDMPGKTMNVFSADLMDALDALMDQVESDAKVAAVVITSGKPTFLAGADLTMVRSFTDAARTATHDEMFQLCGRLGRQFVRLEASPKPWVAAVNGIALGGGLELALACRVRLVADDPRIQLGTPEVRWGLLPGAGGTQRLPRLTELDAAFDLLLTGRSIAPQAAVDLGLFDRAVPSADLLDEAKAAARALRGQPYDVARKYPKIARLEVPPYDTLTARELARRHGVSDEDFARYPAYSAIVDSVLKGARLPLAEATAVEMTQFLRLMFDSVAGRMIRALFLERLRADRELAAAAGVSVRSIKTGKIGAGVKAWADALGRLKIPVEVDATLLADTIAVVGGDGKEVRARLGVVDAVSNSRNDALPLAILSPTGPYGRVVEIAGADAATLPLVTALATLLRTLPWPTPGPTSVLQALAGKSLPDQAAVALIAAAHTGAGDPTFLDVAACLSGVTPAWSGGPLAWLWGEQTSMVPRFDAAARHAWATMEPALRRACS